MGRRVYHIARVGEILREDLDDVGFVIDDEDSPQRPLGVSRWSKTAPLSLALPCPPKRNTRWERLAHTTALVSADSTGVIDRAAVDCSSQRERPQRQHFQSKGVVARHPNR